jgi:phosphate transport system permease protein
MRPEDVGVLVGSAAAAVAALWLVFDQMTLLSGAFGFVVCCVVIFLALYWWINVQLHGRLVANDRLLSAAVGLGAISLAVPLAFMMGFVAVKGWHLLRPTLFTEDLKGVPEIPIPGLHKTGGLSQAIVGTLEQVGIAALFGVPAGIMERSRVTALIGPSGRGAGRVRRPGRKQVREVDVPPHPQPHARGGPRRPAGRLGQARRLDIYGVDSEATTPAGTSAWCSRSPTRSRP